MATASITKKLRNTHHGSYPSKGKKGGAARVNFPTLAANSAATMGPPRESSAPAGRFGPWGGRYVPETLMAALEELEREYEKAKRDPRFHRRPDYLLRTYAGRPS